MIGATSRGTIAVLKPLMRLMDSHSHDHSSLTIPHELFTRNSYYSCLQFERHWEDDILLYSALLEQEKHHCKPGMWRLSSPRQANRLNLQIYLLFAVEPSSSVSLSFTQYLSLLAFPWERKLYTRYYETLSKIFKVQVLGVDVNLTKQDMNIPSWYTPSQ